MLGGGGAPKGSRAQPTYAAFPPEQLKKRLSLSPLRGALPKAIEFQNAAMEQWNKVHEQLTGDAKERHEREKPMPVKSVLRSTDVFCAFN